MSPDRRTFYRAVLGLLVAPWMARVQRKAADSPHRAVYFLFLKGQRIKRDAE
jgi:hypothetical protein